MKRSDQVEKPVGIYKTNDPLRNLKIRVCLKKSTPSAFLLDDEEINGKDVDSYEITQFAANSEFKEYTFNWQEKVFNKYELKHYADEDRCNGFLEACYHKKILKLINSGIKIPSCLFSYVDADMKSEKYQPQESLNAVISELKSYLAEQMKSLKLRHNAARYMQLPVTSGIKIVTKWPSKDVAMAAHLSQSSFQTMYIMADLQSSDSEEIEEVVLCAISADTKGTVIVSPDFNRTQKPYAVQNKKLEIFEYYLENASSHINEHKVESERNLFKKLYLRNTELMKTAVGNEFDVPVADILRLYIYGEIVSAKDFDSNSLYVHYFIDLPENWHSVNSELDGITQACATKKEDKDEVAYFCFPFDIHLECKIDPFSMHKVDIHKCPQIFVEVFAINWWGHCRTEGYGHCSLPISAGSHTLELNCWRPIILSCISNLSRFFIGETQELEDLMYAGIPSSFEGQQLSRFGFHTLSTGTVTIKLNIIQQCKSFTAAARKRKNFLYSHLGMCSKDSISYILSAFHRARQRMMDARSKLEKNVDLD